MKRIVVAIMAFTILDICFFNLAIADEVVFCVSDENRYVVLAGREDNCLEEETELKISGYGINIADGLVPIASFTVINSCPEGTVGTRTEVGLDYNSNGRLEPLEILSTTSYCRMISTNNN